MNTEGGVWSQTVVRALQANSQPLVIAPALSVPPVAQIGVQPVVTTEDKKTKKVK